MTTSYAYGHTYARPMNDLAKSLMDIHTYLHFTLTAI